MRITAIRNPWRDNLLPASFKGAFFHCEVNSIESGRRIVSHQFPKNNYPWAEDMGREAGVFTVRGYCIAYPNDAIATAMNVEHTLYQRDYRKARNYLASKLNEVGAGELQLPTYGALMVVCSKYRLTEEERFGGYCVFDMMFQEQGIDPQLLEPDADTKGKLFGNVWVLRETVKAQLSPPEGGTVEIGEPQIGEPSESGTP